MNLTKKTIKGGAVRFTSLVLKGALQLFVISFFARYISPIEFGIISIITSMLAFVSMFSEIGLGPALIQRQNINKTHIEVAFSTSILFSIFVYLVLFLFSPQISEYYKEPVLNNALKYAGLSFLFSGMGIVSTSLLRKELDFKTIMFIDLASFFISYCVLGIILIRLDYGIWAYLSGIVGQTFISTALYFLAKPHSVKPNLEKTTFKELFHFAGFLTIEKLFNTIGRQADQIISGKLLGLSNLGIYGRSNQLMDIPNQYIGQAIDNVLFPAMSIKQNQSEILKTSYLRSIALVNLLMFPLSIFVIIWANEIVEITFGARWEAVTLPLQILCVVLPFKTSIKVTDSLVRAMGAFQRSAYIKILYAILVITFTLISWPWGIEGVAVGVNLALLINYFVTTTLAKKLVRFESIEYKKTYYAGLILGSITLLCSLTISYLLRDVWQTNIYIRLFIGLCSTVILNGSLLLIFPKSFGSSWEWIYSTLLDFIHPKHPKLIALKKYLTTFLKDN